MVSLAQKRLRRIAYEVSTSLTWKVPAEPCPVGADPVLVEVVEEIKSDELLLVIAAAPVPEVEVELVSDVVTEVISALVEVVELSEDEVRSLEVLVVLVVLVRASLVDEESEVLDVDRTSEDVAVVVLSEVVTEVLSEMLELDSEVKVESVLEVELDVTTTTVIVAEDEVVPASVDEEESDVEDEVVLASVDVEESDVVDEVVLTSIDEEEADVDVSEVLVTLSVELELDAGSAVPAPIIVDVVSLAEELVVVWSEEDEVVDEDEEPSLGATVLDVVVVVDVDVTLFTPAMYPASVYVLPAPSGAVYVQQAAN